MGALTSYFVDPSIAGDSGAGTIGDPYGDIQHALDTVTRDATNGDKFNIKAGADEILTAILSLATYGSPSGTAPLTFRGYTSAEDDGGQGGIDGNGGNHTIISDSFTHFIDMDLHNTGSANIIGTCGSLQQCELHNTTNKVGNSGQPLLLIGCNVYDMSGSTMVISAHCLYNYFDNTQTKKAGVIIDTGSVNAIILGNIINVGPGTTTVCIKIADDSVSIIGNSILGAASTASGIEITSEFQRLTVLNNLFEGLSGTGGAGINGASRAEGYSVFGHNAFYNCTTNLENVADVIHDLGDNESLSASPFAKSGANTFPNRLPYFAPVDTGNVHGGAYGQN